MSFHSYISIPPLEKQLSYNQSIVTLGSCFSDHIGRLLEQHRFDVSVNPLGILYNPHIIAHHLDTSITTQTPQAQAYITREGLTYHHNFHSSFRDQSQANLEEILNKSYQTLAEKLKSATTLIVTLGTAVGYRKNESGQLVGNCHKLPQNLFTQTLIDTRAITTRLSTVFCAIREYNPNIQIILTVSPVRYLKFGAVTNNRSKAQLLTAAMRLEQRHDFVSYWPAYEVFIDELRDYRWVESDLVHPNRQAIQHIWSRFIDTALTDGTIAILNEVRSINSQLSHRPFNPQSESHINAQSDLRKRINNLKKKYPDLKLSEDEVII